MPRYCLQIAYEGSQFSGWQRQKHSLSVQEVLEKAISKVGQEDDLRIFCAGRTDAGVHATSQWVHFQVRNARPLKAWILGVNAYLPRSVAVLNAYEVAFDFHARFSALYRRYHYIVSDRTDALSRIFDVGRVACLSWKQRTLDVEKMHKAAQCLLGRQDFTSFRASNCQSKTAVRDIHFINVYRQPHSGYIVFDIQANAFLYHMVRNIVGSLIRVGENKSSVGWIQTLLSEKNRCFAAKTAPSEGLYLVEVGYESKDLPVSSTYQKPILFV